MSKLYTSKMIRPWLKFFSLVSMPKAEPRGHVRKWGGSASRFILWKFLSTLLLIAVTFIACARLQKHDVDARLISEMEKNCRKVEIKMDYDQGVYVIAYTGKVSKGGCPLALIRGWKEDRLIEEKQVEICGCKDR